MKKITFLSKLAVLFVAIMFTSCKKATFINIDKQAVTFQIEGGSETVSVSSDGSWEVTSCPEWVKAEATSDSTLLLTVDANKAEQLQEGVLTLAGGEVTSEINVKQFYKATYIKVSETEVKIGKEGGTQVVTIDADGMVDHEVTGDITPTFEGDKITITQPANEGGAITAVVTLKAEGIDPVSINIVQDGNICPTCNGTGKVKCTKCKGKGSIDYLSHVGSCTKCGGKGEGDMLVRFGTGKMKCPTCGGTGK